MVNFVLTSVCVTLLSLLLAMLLLATRRHVVIKPSFVCATAGLMDAFGSTWAAPIIYDSLRNPWHHLICTQVVTLLLFVISSITSDALAKEIWAKVASVPAKLYIEIHEHLWILAALTVVCVAIYFVFVPPWRSGLWVALAYGDAIESRDSREASLKLLPALPRYVFSFNRDVVARMLAAALALVCYAQWHVLRKRVFILLPLAICALAVSASLYGARAPGGMVIATAMVAILIYRRLPLNPIYILIGLGFVLLLPTSISITRVGGEITVYSLWSEFYKTILYRLFITEVDVAMWHMDYVQRYGFWGITSIPKLANLFGVQSVNVDNLIMNIYYKPTATGLATVSAFVTNYTRFGLLGGTLFSLVFCSLLNYTLLVTKNLKPVLLLPALVTLLASIYSSIGSSPETLFITRGLLPGILLFWMLNSYMSSPRIATGDRQPARA